MRKFVVLAVFFGILGAGISAPFAGEEYKRHEMVAEVLSGNRTVAKAAWWGFDPDDSTKHLQEAINSGAATLIVENTGADWIVGPIDVASNIEMVFEDGVVVRAKRGEFKEITDSLFRIHGKDNVTMRGEGDVLFVMNKADYQNPDLYRRSGHRHALLIWASRNVLIHNLTLSSSGGDGIYVGYSPRTGIARDIVIDRVVSRDHLRQGLSVTGVTNMLVRDSRFIDTKGAAPEAGIDLEPNFPECSIVNFVAENCSFEGNAYAGILIQLMMLDHTSEPASITFRNCKINGNAYGINIANTGRGATASPGRIEFIGIEISDTGIFPMLINRQVVENMELVFKDIVIDNRKSETREAVRMSTPESEGVFGLRIEGMTVINDNDLMPIRYIRSFGKGLVDPVIKDVKTVRSDGTVVKFDAEKFVGENIATPEALSFTTPELDISGLIPVSANGRAAGEEIRYRHRIDFLQYAEPGQKIPITLIYKPLRQNPGLPPMPVIVENPSGVVVDRVEIPYNERIEYTLNAEERGVYKLKINTGFQTASIKSPAPGQGVVAAHRLPLLLCSGELYFHVPAGVKDIHIGAASGTNEPATIYLLDPEGREADSGIGIEHGMILSYSRKDVSHDEVWSIKFEADKLFLRMGAPLVPVFSSAPENLLIMKQR